MLDGRAYWCEGLDDWDRGFRDVRKDDAIAKEESLS